MKGGVDKVTSRDVIKAYYYELQKRLEIEKVMQKTGLYDNDKTVEELEKKLLALNVYVVSEEI